MSDVEQLADQVARVFKQIEHEQMAGIPLLNAALRVQTLGFQNYEGRRLGIVITPWMMSLLLFPGAEDDWAELPIGQKVLNEFPTDTYEFLVNEIPELGVCLTRSLCSPMHDFHSQDQAVVVAKGHLKTLMEPVEQSAVDPEDEALLNRILRGEEPLPAEPDLCALNEPRAAVGEGRPSAARTLEERVATPITRRDLLRGHLRRDS